ncbi:hypothetical protein ABK040_005895 [Willaertia magna]
MITCSHFDEFIVKFKDEEIVQPSMKRKKKKEEENNFSSYMIELTVLNSKLSSFYSNPSTFQKNQHNCCNSFNFNSEYVMCSTCYSTFPLPMKEKNNQSTSSSCHLNSTKQLIMEYPTTCLYCKKQVIHFYLSQKEFYCLSCKEFIIFDNDSVKYNLLPCLRSTKKKNTLKSVTPITSPTTINNNNTKSVTPTTTTTSIVKKNNLSSLNGLRGMINLGSTCFMNCILQTLCHNPILRKYYLSGIPTKIVKEIENMEKIKLTKELKTFISINYVIHEMFNEIFILNQTKKSPFVPHKFLYTMWNAAEHLALNQQQDAHEFYIALLDSLCPIRLPETSQKLFIEPIFKGELQSDIKCLNCGSISTTLEPFMDISLSLNRDKGDDEFESLNECLDHFTKSEKLESDSYKCQYCVMKGKCTKQLRFKTLPGVLCFHFKRFEQLEKRKNVTSYKIDDFISYPSSIDMTSYMFDSDVKKDSPEKKKNNDYYLYSVVAHSGDLDTGHYTCFIKHNGNWYLCNDDFIYYASEEDALSAEAYLLFYAKKEED